MRPNTLRVAHRDRYSNLEGAPSKGQRSLLISPDPILEYFVRYRRPVTIIGVGVIVLAALVAAEIRAAHPARGPVCVPRPLLAYPSAFHFTPGLEEHRSWIEFPVPEPDATGFTLCLDGHLWEAGIGQTPQNGVVRVSVRTTFVTIEWLLGRLDDFRVPGRWQLGYTTYTLRQQGR